MIANLLIKVIVGGYETFVSRLGLHGHPDEPEWLSRVNAGISQGQTRHGAHRHVEGGSTAQAVVLQVTVHLTFVVSALLLPWTDRVSSVVVVTPHERLISGSPTLRRRRLAKAIGLGKTSVAAGQGGQFIASPALWY
jgi:Uncharacterized protein family, UPF0114